MSLEPLYNVERQERILQLLNEKKRISVDEICELFSISKATARRDLEVLTEQKSVSRVHGGAVSLKTAPPESPFLQRETAQAEEKKSIGKACAQLVQNGETVFLGSGTTVLEVAKELKDRKGLTIVTNSLPVLNLLSGIPNISVIGLGGLFRESELSFIGQITERALDEIRVDKVIIGIHAIHLELGLTNDYLPEAMTDKAIMKAGNQVIVVTDHTKINTVSAAFLAPVTSIQKLITDHDTSVEFIAALKEKGIEVIVA
ncbi:MAG: DeoR family transcriptional regulator [uncultured bacterium]|nr:MAG: DeoR family transcriptional regulator [uncultured bacterium]HBY01141.1 DeoR/GlpR transcriptional regulator [Rikenellaceae bacterium]